MEKAFGNKLKSILTQNGLEKLSDIVDPNKKKKLVREVTEDEKKLIYESMVKAIMEINEVAENANYSLLSETKKKELSNVLLSTLDGIETWKSNWIKALREAKGNKSAKEEEIYW